jgi:ketosteroid isomerase-like protein
MTFVANISTGASMRAAMERRDIRAVADAFADDAEFHSPLTDKLTFKGRAGWHHPRCVREFPLY